MLKPCPFCGTHLVEKLHRTDTKVVPYFNHPDTGCILDALRVYNKTALWQKRDYEPNEPVVESDGPAATPEDYRNLSRDLHKAARLPYKDDD